MKTVIVKARVKDKIALMKNIQATGNDFGKSVFQNDRVFLPRGYQPSRNLPKLMLRTELIDPRRKPWYQLIQKRHIVAENTDLIHITPVLDYAETAHIIQQLGFDLRVEIMRHRQKMEIDEVVFYLDDVEGLGSYIKLEREVFNGESPEIIRQELWNILRVLGVDESTSEPETYTAQMLAKKAKRQK